MPNFDIIFIMPYPLSDHPSFPEGILKKALEYNGFSVGLIEKPFWQDKNSFKILGTPKLFFAVISGPMDSMVLNYTSSLKRRNEDLYQIGSAFFEDKPKSIKYKIRPDRTTIVFSNKIREAFKDAFIVIGGIEASLRCFAHYDFQQVKIRRSILLDSKADILVLGRGEKQIVKIASMLKSGQSDFKHLSGTANILNIKPQNQDFITLPSFESILNDPLKFIEMNLSIEDAHLKGIGIIQQHLNRYITANKPENYTSLDFDNIYKLKYSRSHIIKNIYSPACSMNLFSITSHHGCAGGCSFCSISSHEGKKIISRSGESIIREIKDLTSHPQWKGYISDIGGASAEMYGNYCEIDNCKRYSCIYPEKCKNFDTGINYLNLLKEVKKIKGVKKIFLGSGVRHDLLLKNPELLEEILLYHSGKFIRIAPEHTQNNVLNLMRKSKFEDLEEFIKLFNSINKNLKRKIDLALYLMVGHPGETMNDVLEMKKIISSLKIKYFTKDVQIFTPTPGTLSTAMYYSELSLKLNNIYVEKNINLLMKRKLICCNK